MGRDYSASRNGVRSVTSGRKKLETAVRFAVESLEQRVMLTIAAPSSLNHDLAAAPSGGSSVFLTWNDNSSNETGFKIERKTGSGGTWSQIGTAGANAIAYSDTSVSAATTYYYRVRATNATEDSAYSNEDKAINWDSVNLDTASGGSTSTTGSGASAVTTIVSNGLNIGGTSDSARFVYRTFDGDGEIVARVASVQNTSGYARAAAMFRNSLAANSSNVSISITPGGGARMTTRYTDGAGADDRGFTGYSAPYWVKLKREGSTFSGYVSSNGTSWTLVRQVSVSMGTAIYAGLAVAGNNSATVFNTSTFDNVTVDQKDDDLPINWSGQDIGTASGMAGTSRFDHNAFTFAVESSAQSVGGTSDAFHFAHRTLAGDGEMIAKVDSMLGTDGNSPDVYSQAGIMFRDGTAANARFVFMNLGPTSSSAYRSVFYYRTTTGGTAAYTAGSGVIPGWIKLTRSGTTFTGYASTDGSTWTQVGSITISGMPTSLEAGLALSAQGYGHVDTATFSNVKLTAAAPTNLIATAIHAHEIDLVWNDNSQSEDGFAIDRSTDGGTTWTNIANLTGATAYVDSTVQPGTNYTYRARSYIYLDLDSTTHIDNTWYSAAATSGSVNTNNVGDGLTGTYYDNVDFTGTNVTRIDPVLNLHLNPGDAPVSGIAASTFAAEWRGQVKTDGTAGTFTFSTLSDDGVRVWINNTLLIDNWEVHSPATNAATITLAANTKYNVLVQYFQNAATADMTLSWKTPASGSNTTVIPTGNLYSTFVTPPDVPAAPADLDGFGGDSDHIQDVQDGDINLSWSPVSGAAFYNFYRSDDFGVTWIPAGSVAGSLTQWTDVGPGPVLDIKKNYAYRVVAVSAGGHSSATDMFAAPTAVTVNATQNTAKVSWDDNSNEEMGYIVGRTSNGGATWETRCTLPANSTTFTDSNLTSGQTYSYRVVGAAEQVASAGRASPPQVAAAPSIVPVNATFFARTDLSGTSTNLTYADLKEFKWTGKSPVGKDRSDNSFSAIIVSTFTAPATGTYTFKATTNGGVRLYVNNTKLFDRWMDVRTIPYPADSNYDGAVDFNDLVSLGQHYNGTVVDDAEGTRWNKGDFTDGLHEYTSDGRVDFNDLVKLAQNYNSVEQPVVDSGMISLTANQSYPIRIEYMNQTTAATLNLEWQPAGASGYSEVPADHAPVSPTQLSMTLTSPPTANEGDTATVTLTRPSIPPSGTDPITAWAVQWGSEEQIYDANPSSNTTTATYTWPDNGTYVVTAQAIGASGLRYNVGATATVIVNNVAPTATSDASIGGIEGQLVTLYAAGTDPGVNDTLTYHWHAVSSNQQSLADGNGATYNFTPSNDGVYQFELTATDNSNATSTAQLITVHVSDSAPSVLISGDAMVAEQGSYTLSLQAHDIAADVISAWRINWGDGTTSDVSGSTTSKSHVFADGVSQAYVTATAYQGSAQFQSNTLLVSIVNESPNLSVDGDDNVNESSSDNYHLSLLRQGDDQTSIQNWYIDWGDGVHSTIDGDLQTANHHYKDGPDDYLISVEADDEDGRFAVGTKAVHVDNVAPVASSHFLAASIPSGGIASLSLINYFDPGDDSLVDWWIDWGDGTQSHQSISSGLNAQHRYPVGSAHTYQVTSSISDDDGWYNLPTTHETVGGSPSSTLNVSLTDDTSSIYQGDTYSITLHAGDNDSQTQIRSWIVDWGDGKQNTYVWDGGGSAETVGHIFNVVNSNYHVNVTAKTLIGTTTVGTRNVEVKNQPPTVEITSSQQTVIQHNPYTVRLSTSNTGADPITGYAINWGDGSAIQNVGPNESLATHEYNLLGDFTISATASDATGTFQATGNLSVHVKSFVPPAAPSNLTVVATTTGSVTLTWTDNSDNEEEFLIDQIEPAPIGVDDIRTGRTGNLVSHSSDPVTGQRQYVFTLPNEDANRPLRFRVRAKTPYGLVSTAAVGETIVSATTAVAQPNAQNGGAVPAGVTGVTAATTNLGSASTIAVDFDEVPANTDGFDMEVTDGLTVRVVRADTFTNNPARASVRGEHGKTYTVRIRAWNHYGNSAWSAPVTFTTGGFNAAEPAPPAAPSVVIDTPGSANIPFHWEGVPSFTGYQVYVSSDNSHWFPSNNMTNPAISGTTFSSSISGYYSGSILVSIQRNTTYWIRVDAVTTDHAIGAAAQVTTKDIEPFQVSGLTVRPVGFGQVQLVWNDESDNESQFEIKYRKSAGGAEMSKLVAANTTSTTISQLDLDTAYEFKIRGVGTPDVAEHWTPYVPVVIYDADLAVDSIVQLHKNDQDFDAVNDSSDGYDANQSAAFDADDSDYGPERFGRAALKVPGWVNSSNATVKFTQTGSGVVLWSTPIPPTAENPVLPVRNAMDKIEFGRAYHLWELPAGYLYIEGTTQGAQGIKVQIDPGWGSSAPAGERTEAFQVTQPNLAAGLPAAVEESASNGSQNNETGTGISVAVDPDKTNPLTTRTPLVISAPPGVNDPDATYSLSILSVNGQGSAALFDAATGGNEVTGQSFTLVNGSRTYYMQGLSAGELHVSLVYNHVAIYVTTPPTLHQTASLAGLSSTVLYDFVKVSVVGVDVDVDSFNDSGYLPDPHDQNTAEDIYEAAAGLPGKIVAVNSGDKDNDGIPDYADGYNRDGTSNNADDTNQKEQFVPMLISLPLGMDPALTSIKIEYANSADPGAVTFQNGTWSPGSGTMRLWRVAGSGVRNKSTISQGGDYIPGGTVVTATELGLNEFNRQVTVWVEAIAPSVSLGDQVVTVTAMFTPVGGSTSAPLTSADVVRLNFNKIDLDADSDNTSFNLPDEAHSLDGPEEKIEDEKDKPGKIVVVNDADRDHDGRVDFADANANSTLVPIVLKVPGSMMSSVENIRIEYDASDPNLDVSSGQDVNTAYTPAPGHLRLWKGAKDGSGPASKNPASIRNGGTYVGSGFYSADELGLSASSNEDQYITLYVEAVRPSATLGDLSIKVSLYAWGGYDLNNVSYAQTFESLLTDGHGHTSPTFPAPNQTPAYPTSPVLLESTKPILTDEIRLTALADSVMSFGDGAAMVPGGEVAGSVGQDPASMGYSGAVRLSDGSVSFSATDLVSGAFGMPWGQTRTWTNQLAFALDSTYGNGWVVSQTPSLIQGSSAIVEIASGRSARYFDKLAGTDIEYQSRFFTPDSLKYDATSKTFTLADSLGNRTEFYGFETLANGQPVPEAQRGKFKQFTDAGGNVTLAVYNSSGVLQQINRGTTSGESPAESFKYSYISSGDNKGKLHVLELQRNGATVSTATYDYYGKDESNGQLGDLKTVMVNQLGQGNVDQSYYRYYKTSGDGKAGQLKLAMSTAGLARFGASGHGDFSSADDKDLVPYADTYLTYDSNNRAQTQSIPGAGPSGGDTHGTYQYTYAPDSSSGRGSGMNVWKNKTTVTLINAPGVATNTVYTNFAGEVILDQNAGDNKVWKDFYHYDEAGRLTFHANPSAVQTVSESAPDLLNSSGGNYAGLQDHAGLIEGYAYNAEGYLAETYDRHGEGDTGAATHLASYSYDTTDFGGFTSHYLSSQTVYSSAGGTGEQTTTFTPTNFTQFKPGQIVTTLPIVSVAHNGSGAAQHTTSVLDGYGRVTSFTDADNYTRTTQYDPATGCVSDTSQQVGSGQSNITTHTEYDAQGRPQSIRDGNGNTTTVVYTDTLTTRKVATSPPSGSNAPTSVVYTDLAQGFVATAMMSGNVLTSLTRSTLDASGRVVWSDRYFDVAGANLTDPAPAVVPGSAKFYRSTNQYGAAGRLDYSVNAVGTVTRTNYDSLGRPIAQKIGVDPISLITVQKTEYDNNSVGDGNATKITLYPNGAENPILASDPNRVTQNWYDWRDRAVASKAGTGVGTPLTVNVLDNLGRVTEIKVYDNATPTVGGDGEVSAPAGSLVGMSTSRYDGRGRVFSVQQFNVNQETGAVLMDEASNNESVTLTTKMFYDGRGDVVETRAPGGLVTKAFYDGAGRVTTTTTGSTTTVVEATSNTYDANGNLLMTSTSQSKPGGGMRSSYRANWYDAANRLTDSADVGTNNDMVYGRPTNAPARLDSVLVTTLHYDAAGHNDSIKDPKGVAGIETKMTYDALGRLKSKTENNVDGASALGDRNKLTSYTYTALDQPQTVTVQNTSYDGSVQTPQTTTYHYGNEFSQPTLKGDGPIGIVNPGETHSAPVYFYNALGEVYRQLDRSGVWHDFAHDTLGRVISDQVSFASDLGVEGGVKKHLFAYDALGSVTRATSEGPTSANGNGWGVKNEVKREYDGLGNLKTEWQAHDGAVNQATSPAVQYEYTPVEQGASLRRIIYWNGRSVWYDHDNIGRVSNLRDDQAGAPGDILETYSYQGLQSVAKVIRPEAGLTQSIQWDNLGQVSDVNWLRQTTSIEHWQYTYDRDGNLLRQTNLASPGQPAVRSYTYDALNRMKSYTSGSSTQSWQQDAMGNRTGGKYGAASYQAQSNVRDQNTSSPGGWTTRVLLDESGNMTSSVNYDAWGHATQVRGEFHYDLSYDALGRRIVTSSAPAGVSATRKDDYYSGTQLIEEYDSSGHIQSQWVWSAAGVPVVVLRDRNADKNINTGFWGKNNSGLEERLYSVTDGRGNTTAIVNHAIADANASVVERFNYDPDGESIAFQGDWSAWTTQPTGGESHTQWDQLFGQMRWMEVYSTSQSPPGKSALGFYEVGGGTQSLYDPQSGRMLVPSAQPGLNGYDPDASEWYDRGVIAVAPALIASGITYLTGGLAARWAWGWAATTWMTSYAFTNSTAGRYASGQTGWQSIGGGVADASGFSAVYASKYNQDFITGADLNLSFNQRQVLGVLGLVQIFSTFKLASVVSGPLGGAFGNSIAGFSGGAAYASAGMTLAGNAVAWAGGAIGGGGLSALSSFGNAVFSTRWNGNQMELFPGSRPNVSTAISSGDWASQTGRAYDRRFTQLWRRFEGQQLGDWRVYSVNRQFISAGKTIQPDLVLVNDAERRILINDWTSVYNAEHYAAGKAYVAHFEELFPGYRVTYEEKYWRGWESLLEATSSSGTKYLPVITRP